LAVGCGLWARKNACGIFAPEFTSQTPVFTMLKEKPLLFTLYSLINGKYTLWAGNLSSEKRQFREQIIGNR
jgi:hypothetical protein